jgi:hypothetical protein
MYILPNGRKLTEKDLEFLSYAMWSQDESVFFTFSKRTGRIIPIASVREEIRQKVKESDNQFMIPRVGKNMRRRWIVEFAELCVPMWNPELADRLIDMVAEMKSPKELTTEIANCPEGSIYGWGQFRSDKLGERYQAWFCSLPFRIRNDYREMYPGDGPLEKELREHAQKQDDRQYFANRLEVVDPEEDGND